MAITKAQIQADSRLAFDDFPTETVVIAGTSYEVLLLDRQDSSAWGIGGETLETGLKVLIDRDNITTMPAEGDTATFGAVTFRVTNVERDDAGAPVVVDLTRPEL